MENKSEDRDHLHFRNEKGLKSIIGDEELLFSDKLVKINGYGFSQERNMIITNKAIYNLKKKVNKLSFNFKKYSIKKTYLFKYYIRNNSK